MYNQHNNNNISETTDLFVNFVANDEKLVDEKDRIKYEKHKKLSPINEENSEKDLGFDNDFLQMQDDNISINDLMNSKNVSPVNVYKIKLEKFTLLTELANYKKNGYLIPDDLNLNTDIEKLKMIHDYTSTLVQKQDKISIWNDSLQLSAELIDKLSPVSEYYLHGLKLEGVGSIIKEKSSQFDRILNKIYDMNNKIGENNTSSPYTDLLMLFITSIGTNIFINNGNEIMEWILNLKDLNEQKKIKKNDKTTYDNIKNDKNKIDMLKNLARKDTNVRKQEETNKELNNLFTNIKNIDDYEKNENILNDHKKMYNDLGEDIFSNNSMPLLQQMQQKKQEVKLKGPKIPPKLIKKINNDNDDEKSIHSIISNSSSTYVNENMENIIKNSIINSKKLLSSNSSDDSKSIKSLDSSSSSIESKESKNSKNSKEYNVLGRIGKKRGPYKKKN